mmetsp:Transcript_19730/g.54235  ORF Transcript_19730/g.54235 Transcript_19730/m.54235 type:complete len:203 (-) Transcript_19730:142-750(-)
MVPQTEDTPGSVHHAAVPGREALCMPSSWSVAQPLPCPPASGMQHRQRPTVAPLHTAAMSLQPLVPLCHGHLLSSQLCPQLHNGRHTGGVQHTLCAAHRTCQNLSAPASCGRKHPGATLPCLLCHRHTMQHRAAQPMRSRPAMAKSQLAPDRIRPGGTRPPPQSGRCRSSWCNVLRSRSQPGARLAKLPATPVLAAMVPRRT